VNQPDLRQAVAAAYRKRASNTLNAARRHLLCVRRALEPVTGVDDLVRELLELERRAAQLHYALGLLPDHELGLNRVPNELDRRSISGTFPVSFDDEPEPTIRSPRRGRPEK
jgi:hypothetical protein